MRYKIFALRITLTLLLGFMLLASYASAQTVYVTNTGKKYHDSGCRYLSKSKITATLSDAKEVQGELRDTTYTITKNMYKRNIAILETYRGMDLKKWHPKEDQTFLKKSTGNPILTIKGLEIETKPSSIYTFGKKDAEKIGAIWFTAKVNGYSLEEVGEQTDEIINELNENLAA